LEVIENPDLRRKLTEAGRQEVCKYTFDVTAQRYYHELYKELL
jgi:glycosyltransferase involved in cell wall biosynthesis